MLVATGMSASTGMPTEIIDLVNSSFACPNLGLFPREMHSGVGSLINGKPFICGGGHNSTTNYGECYSLGENGDWIEDQVATLKTPRAQPATGSLTINKKLVVAGGWDGSKPLTTIELASLGTESEILPFKLPVGLDAQPCVVSWSSDAFMLIGGRSNASYQDFATETYFIDIVNNTIINGPNLQTGRRHLVCEEMIINGSSFIIVAGGIGATGILNSTEMLSKSAVENGWQPGQIALKKIIRISVTLSFQDLIYSLLHAVTKWLPLLTSSTCT